MNNMNGIKDGKNLLGRLVDGESFESIEKDYRRFEKSVLSSPFVLQFATEEEMASYELLEKLPDEDVDKALGNMVEALGLNKKEEEIIMSMDKHMLKLILIEKWLTKAEEFLADNK